MCVRYGLTILGEGGGCVQILVLREVTQSNQVQLCSTFKCQCVRNSKPFSWNSLPLDFIEHCCMKVESETERICGMVGKGVGGRNKKGLRGWVTWRNMAPLYFPALVSTFYHVWITWWPKEMTWLLINMSHCHSVSMNFAPTWHRDLKIICVMIKCLPKWHWTVLSELFR